MIPNIAIQGHPTRGKEVIQILESLGGKILYYSDAFDKYLVFFINDKGYISCFSRKNPLTKEYYKIYTLEEFETQFPFKIGDTVITTLNHVGTIIGIVNDKYKVLFKEDSSLIAPHRLKPYKEMKEERNITLTLEKANEWYNKGGELKEVALQAYSEEELIKIELPKTWEEFCKNYPIKAGECWIGAQCFINVCKTDLDGRLCRNWIPSVKSAEAHLALIQLEQLRDCYRRGDIPDFTKAINKYCIAKVNKQIEVVTSSYTSYFLSFTKKEIAEKFLIYFKPLIKIAEDYI